jgi:hypothetical protein
MNRIIGENIKRLLKTSMENTTEKYIDVINNKNVRITLFVEMEIIEKLFFNWFWRF